MLAPRPHRLSVLLAVVVVPLVLPTASGCHRSSGTPSEQRQPEGSATIGPQGGVVEVASASSPLAGTRLVVPAGALAAPTTITISLFPANGLARVPTVDKLPLPALALAEIGPSGTTFAVPARLTLRYPDEDADGLVDGVPVHSAAMHAIATAAGSNAWQWLEGIVDTSARTIAFEIDHLSAFGVARSRSLQPGLHRVWFESAAGAPGFGQQEAAVVMEVLQQGLWRPLTERAGFAFERAMHPAEASVRIGWDMIARTGGGDLPLAATYVQPSPMVVYFNADPAIAWSLAPTNPPTGTKHLRSVALHEFAHVLGLYGGEMIVEGTRYSHLDRYASATDVIWSRDTTPVHSQLGENDPEWFVWRHPVVFRDCSPTAGIDPGRPTIEVTVEALQGRFPSTVFRIEMLIGARPAGRLVRWTRGEPSPIQVVEQAGGRIVTARWPSDADLGPGDYTIEVRALTTHAWPSGLELGVPEATKRWTLMVSACDGFPPPAGARRTFRVAGGPQFTTVTQPVQERVEGEVVQRVHVLGDPPGLGLYVGCSRERGDIDVATDWWEPANPQVNGRDSWQPPLYRVPSGGLIGERAVWSGNFGNFPEQSVTQILDWEYVQVPAGGFVAMKMLELTYHTPGQPPEQVVFWIDPAVGPVRGEDDFAVLELVSYSGGAGAARLGSGPAQDLGLLRAALRRHRAGQLRTR